MVKSSLVVQNWLMSSFLPDSQIPSISRSARSYRDSFSTLYSDGSGGRCDGRGRRGEIREGVTRNESEEGCTKAKENTQVTPNRSMSEARGVSIPRIPTQKGMFVEKVVKKEVQQRRSGENPKEMVVMTSESDIRKM